MSEVLDATERRHPVGPKRERIVSLVPSTTETLFALGAGERILGVTRFCVRPKGARERAKVVGGTKTPDIDAILALDPDLVFANREENRREDVLRLRERVPVFVAFPKSVAEAAEDVRSAGKLLGRVERGESLASEIGERLREVRAARREFRYLYFIWRRPYMVAGPSTFVAALLAEAGGSNAAPRDRGRYPELGPGDVENSGADALLLASEPFPFGEKHVSELAATLEHPAALRDRIFLVDGELLSWHGTRLLEGLPYLRALVQRMVRGI